MDSPAERLRKARVKAGFKSASEAAKAFGWPVPAYIHHENGTRGLKTDVAIKYASGLRVRPAYILTGEGGQKATGRPTAASTVPLVGRVGAGAEAQFFTLEGSGEEAPAPPNQTDQTVAVEIQGGSLGAAFNGWLAYYDDVRRPITDDLIGRLCIVGLRDGRTVVKIVKRSRAKGLFHLFSNAETAEPILDAEVDWAARVIHLMPK